MDARSFAEGMDAAAQKAEIPKRYDNKTTRPRPSRPVPWSVPSSRTIGPPDMQVHTMPMPRRCSTPLASVRTLSGSRPHNPQACSIRSSTGGERRAELQSRWSTRRRRRKYWPTKSHLDDLRLSRCPCLTGQMDGPPQPPRPTPRDNATDGGEPAIPERPRSLAHSTMEAAFTADETNNVLASRKPGEEVMRKLITGIDLRSR